LNPKKIEYFSPAHLEQGGHNLNKLLTTQEQHNNKATAQQQHNNSTTSQQQQSFHNNPFTTI